MNKEQWKTVLDTVKELENSARYNVPDEETEFWEEAEKADNAINDLKSLVEYKIEEIEEAEETDE